MSWHWWFQTDAGLFARIGIAACVFATLAIYDLYRNGRNARRWREYAYLIFAGLMGIAYGAANDLITSSISWEYFYYGKGLFDLLGPKVPPDSAALHWEAARIGMKAAGSAGLIIGVAFLMANNPRPLRPQLRYSRLAHPLIVAFAICAGCGITGSCGNGIVPAILFVRNWMFDVECSMFAFPERTGPKRTSNIQHRTSNRGRRRQGLMRRV